MGSVHMSRGQLCCSTSYGQAHPLIREMEEMTVFKGRLPWSFRPGHNLCPASASFLQSWPALGVIVTRWVNTMEGIKDCSVALSCVFGDRGELPDCRFFTLEGRIVVVSA